MRCSLATRAAVSLLALVMLFGSIRAAAAACCDDDCDMPCCERDAESSQVLPVLPCCRAVTADQAASHPTPTTVVEDSAPLAVPSVAAAPLLAVIPTSPPLRAARLLPAPPLYQQHCTLLL